MTILMPVGLICTIFFLLWIAKWPEEIVSSMLFRQKKIVDILAGVGIWAYFAGMILFIVEIANKI